jgi:hypothetical protein
MLKCVSVIVVACAVGCGPAAGPRDESIRVATYNAFLLSPFFKCFNPNFADCLLQINGETEAWANHLADTILANTDRFDIIAINEAWDEDAKSILVRRLGIAYPNFVRKIDADLIQTRGADLHAILSGQPAEVVNGLFGAVAIEKINGEDSGLMLFANRKFEFLPLPDPSFKWGTAGDQALEASTSEVAFTLFQSCGSPDCFSAKGAGLVRLRHVATERVYNVIFTHMQADYPEDQEFHTGTRANQFAQIRKLIETTLAPLSQRERNHERLLMMGDLNVSVLSTATEWQSLFNTSGSFYTRPLYDSWARTTSPRDTGITQGNDKDRLDYVLSFPERYERNELEGPVCVQHLTIPVDFQLLESDHYMVHADLNIGFHHCHPQIAYEINLEPVQSPGNPPVENAFIDVEDGQDTTQIKWPGGMQWFHVRKGEAGTYSIGRTNADVRLDVYAADDLTTPISRYNKTTRFTAIGDQRMFVDTFVLPREFYIRTAGSTRSFTGNYALAIKRHTCSSQAEACILQPGQRQSAALTKAGNPFGTQNQAWFQFDVTGTSDSGVDQTIVLTADGLPDPTNFKSSLQSFVNTSGLPAPPAQATGGLRTYRSKMGDGSTGYLVIEQSMPTTVNVTVGALMDTSLRLLDVFNLICEDETNPELGSDDIYTSFTVDGVTTRAPSSGEVEFDCDEPRDEKSWAGAVGKPTVTFVEDVGIRVIEEDDSSANDPSRFKLVPHLAASDMMLDGIKNPLIWNFEGGQYRFTFMLRKRPNAPVK